MPRVRARHLASITFIYNMLCSNILYLLYRPSILFIKKFTPLNGFSCAPPIFFLLCVTTNYVVLTMQCIQKYKTKTNLMRWNELIYPFLVWKNVYFELEKSNVYFKWFKWFYGTIKLDYNVSSKCDVNGWLFWTFELWM